MYTYGYQCIIWQPTCSFQILSLSNYTYVNADYSSYCDTIVDLYMQAYELIRSV